MSQKYFESLKDEKSIPLMHNAPTYFVRLGEKMAELPSFGGQIDAMVREAAKDINNTMHQVFFGQSIGHGESGAPMNPTPQMVTEDLGHNGNDMPQHEHEGHQR